MDPHETSGELFGDAAAEKPQRDGQLLRLADRMAGAEYRNELQVAAETVRAALPEGTLDGRVDTAAGVREGPAPRLRRLQRTTP
ncbi:MAG: hypothetical protein AB1941_05880 [Gemmatimonadota bacterium]